MPRYFTVPEVAAPTRAAAAVSNEHPYTKDISLSGQEIEKDFYELRTDIILLRVRGGHQAVLTKIRRGGKTVLTSALLLVALVALLSFAMLNPAISPFVSVSDLDADGVPDDHDLFPTDPSEWKDTDSDGIGDVLDAFPYDPYESVDSDDDGVGDESDFMDQGNGGVQISLIKFEFDGYTTNCHRTKYYPDPWFEVRVDADCDGDFERVFDSDIFFGAEYLEFFFSVDVDLEDDAPSIHFSIIAYDVWDVDNNEVTDFEILDYMPLDGLMAEDQTMDLPGCCTWTYCGEGDSDAPDCTLEYSVSTVALG